VIIGFVYLGSVKVGSFIQEPVPLEEVAVVGVLIVILKDFLPRIDAPCRPQHQAGHSLSSSISSFF
jgi:hypothetical protein